MRRKYKDHLHKYESLIWNNLEKWIQNISSEQAWKYWKYKKLTARMIQTQPMQSPSNDLGYLILQTIKHCLIVWTDSSLVEACAW